MLNKKRTLAGITAAGIAAIMIPFTALADTTQLVGPGYTDITTTAPVNQEIGPGMNLEPIEPTEPSEPTVPSEPEALPAENPSNYYLQSLDNAIVQVPDQYTYNQMSQDIWALRDRYGSHMSVNSIGKTADNREIYDIIVGNPYAGKHLLIQASMHAREYMTTQLVMKQLEYTLAYYDSGTYEGKSLSSMLDQVAIHFVPMVNPDGVTLSQFGEGGIGSEELRNSIRSMYETDLAQGRTAASYEGYLRIWKANAKGVDLNHNFDAQWNMGVQDTDHPSYSGYKGPNPLSEVETSAVADLIQKYPVKAVINYHAMGQLIYWDTYENKQKDTSLQLAQMFAQRNGYKISNELGRLGAKDWIQSKNPALPSITVEIGRTACPLPSSSFPEIWAQNRGGAALAAAFVIEN